MSGYRTTTSINSGSTAVTSQTVTVPTGVVATDTVIILICTATATAGGHTFTSSTGSGTLAVPTGGLNGATITTTGKITTLLGTGSVATDVITIACPASGITTGILVAYDNTVTFDACGVNLTSGGTATQTTPAVTTSAANCIAVNLVVGLQTATRNISTVSPGTLEASLNGAGGNVRWTAFGVSDQVITSAGSSGTVTDTFSGTLTGAAGQQVSLKPVVVGTADNPGWGMAL